MPQTTLPPIDDAGVDTLISLSRRYGSDPRFCIAGGGNTSIKDDATLRVKASGHALGSIEAGGFVGLERAALEELAQSAIGALPANERESAFKDRVMASRAPGEADLRPSVEALLHHLLPDRYVVHTHSTVVNAVTCCTHGRALTRELFGDDVLWVAYVDPGFILALELMRALSEWRQQTGRDEPEAIFLENHGLIVGGANAEQIDARTNLVVDAIAGRLASAPPAFADTQHADEADTARVHAQRFQALADAIEHELRVRCVTATDDSAVRLASTERGRTAAAGEPLTPDQIVYCGSFPAVINEPHNDQASIERVREHLGDARRTPAVALVANAGIIGIGATEREATYARDVYTDAVMVMNNADRLGGVQHMSEAHRRFIETWEVEAYRKQVSVG